MRLRDVTFLVQGYQLEIGIKSGSADPNASVSHVICPMAVTWHSISPNPSAAPTASHLHPQLQTMLRAGHAPQLNTLGGAWRHISMATVSRTASAEFAKASEERRWPLPTEAPRCPRL